MDRAPTRREKYFAWAMMALISFFFAEIVSGSSMLTSLDPGSVGTLLVWSVIVTIPVYGLHILVLAWVVYRYGRPRLYTLFFAGVLFALYEAYLTKVLWTGWAGNTVWFAGGIAVVETAVLLLFWHPFMAFIVPLFVAEGILTRSREVLSGLPRPLRRLFSSPRNASAALLLFALLCGVYQAGGATSPIAVIASELTACLAFGILLAAYRRRGLHRFGIRELLPTKRELVVLLAWLLLIYLVMGLGIRPETLRNLLPQVIVWLLYAFFVLMLYLSLKKSRVAVPIPREFPAGFSWHQYGAFFLVMTLAAALVNTVPFHLFIALLLMLAGIGAGAVVLALAVRDTLK